MINLSTVDSILLNALMEDIGEGDVTTDAVIPEDHRSKAVIIAQEDFVLAGIPFTERIFQLTHLLIQNSINRGIKAGLKFKAHKKDGDAIKKRTVIATVSGSTRCLLMAERTALNLLQRLSGIASLTRAFVKRVKGLPVKIVDTRKTTPGLRIFEKYAVKAGGGNNHRFGLFDGILIKDNHIHAAGSIEKAVRMAKLRTQHLLKIEVEAKDISEVRKALKAGVDVIMLDNMTIEDMTKSVNLIRRRKPEMTIEASGNIRLENIGKVAEAGVNLISIGALTHSARAVDISMDVMHRRSFVDNDTA